MLNCRRTPAHQQSRRLVTKDVYDKCWDLYLVNYRASYSKRKTQNAIQIDRKWHAQVAGVPSSFNLLGQSGTDSEILASNY